MADPLPTTSGPAGLPTTRIPGITQVVHIVKPQAMVGGMLRTSADPLHEIAVTNTVAMRLHNCISFTSATIFYGQQVSDSVTDTFGTTELSLRRAVLGAFLRMNTEARAIKSRNQDIQCLFRYIFIWYSRAGGPVLPDTFKASAVPTWPQIDDILNKTGIHLSIITPASDPRAMNLFSGLTCREIPPEGVRKAVPVLFPNFKVFVRKLHSDDAKNTQESVEVDVAESDSESSVTESDSDSSGSEESFLELLLPLSETLGMPFQESLED